MAIPMRIHIAIKTSLFNNPHCFTRSALEKNFIAIAISKKPNTTFTEFSHPPDFGRDCSQFGKMANTVKGSARAKPKPASPAVNGHEPCAAVPANNEPRIGPVHEKETIARVNAIKKIPATSRPDRALALFASPPGNLISKYPKKEIANTMKMMKKKRFSQTLVEKLLSTCGDAWKMWNG